MSRVFNLAAKERAPEAVAGEARDAHLAAALDRAATLERTNRALRRSNLIVAAFGVGVGLLGMASAVAVTQTWQPPEPLYIRQDPRTGELSRAPRAIEAAQGFDEGTAKQHLRMVLDYCEAYLFSTVALTTTRCQLFLTPAQRAVFARRMEPTNPDSPQARLGRDGSMSVADRVTYERVAQARDGTQVWAMRFTKVVAKRGTPPECLPWTTVATFRWRPDLKMADEHRVINLGGMQISEYRSGPDAVRKPEC